MTINYNHSTDTITATGSAGTLSGFTTGITVGSGAMTLISQNVVTTAVSSVTFASIVGTYNQLLLCWQAASSGAGSNEVLLLNLNSDTGANYSFETLSITSTSAAGSNSTAQTTANVGIVSTTANANYAGSGEIMFVNYAGTTFFKNIRTAGLAAQGGASVINGYHSHVNWASTAAITTIKLALSSANSFVTGSKFTLYGIT